MQLIGQQATYLDNKRIDVTGDFNGDGIDEVLFSGQLDDSFIVYVLYLTKI